MSLPTFLNTDVAVIGGGPAGMTAAVAAARHGAEVCVIERWPQLGGQSTMSRVCMWHTSDKTREVIFGLTREYVDRLKSYNGIQVLPNFPNTHETYAFHWDWMSIVLDDLAREEKIRVLCSTPCVDVVMEGNTLEAAVIGTKQGLQLIKARRFIDATGSADLASFAGEPTTIGRETDHRVQGMTQVAFFKGLDLSKEQEIKDANSSMNQRMRELQDAGKLPAAGPHHFPGHFIWRWPGTLLLCTEGDPLDPEDITRAAMDARGKLPKFLEFFRQEWPGCENLELDSLAPHLGIRESRRIQGRYVFSGDDILERHSFRDAIGQGFWMVDIHDPDGSGHTTWSDRNTHLAPGTTYQIPYRILLPQQTNNLLVAGRCASATHEGMAGLRVQSHCHIMGQAAGTAAALSLEQNITPADLNPQTLQATLVDDGVFIDQERAATADISNSGSFGGNP